MGTMDKMLLEIQQVLDKYNGSLFISGYCDGGIEAECGKKGEKEYREDVTFQRKP